MRRFISVATWALCVGVCGCNYHPGDTYDVVVESNNTPLAEASLQAVAMWTERVPVHLHVMLSNDCQAGDGRICIHAVTDLHGHADNGYVWADTRPAESPFGLQDGADVFIDVARVPEDRVHVVIAHELGHAMGLGHVQAQALMCPDQSCQPGRVMDIDVQQWHDVRK